MKNPHDVILNPVITERSTVDAASGKYTFAVAKDATKTEIRQACEKLFEVRVVKVNTQNLSGKAKRVGVHLGKTPSWKKAVVTIDMEPKAEKYAVSGGKESQSTRKYKTSIEEFGFGQ